MTTDGKKRKRAFIGMHFKCCHVYARIYVNKQQTAFKGHCPKCAAPVEIKISKDGNSTPFFTSG